MDLLARASAHLARLDGAQSGAGGHDATFKAAAALVKGFGLSPDDALPLMEEFNARCSPPWSLAELRHKLRSADSAPDTKPRGYLMGGEKRHTEEPGVARAPRRVEAKPVFDLGKLRVFANGCREEIDRTWLAERSPRPVEWGNRQGLALEVLSQLFEARDLVLLFKRRWSQGDFGVWRGAGFRLGAERGVSAVRSEIPTESNDGMLLMAAPVDGQWRVSPGNLDKDGRPKWSRRNGACVTRFPYLVLESDSAPVDLWLRALSLLELRIAAIFSSGGKSVHTLVRVDAASKAEFDDCAKLTASVLSVIGADPQALKGLPMSRVPGVLRRETGKIQELWYLNPNPGWGRLADLRRVREVATESTVLPGG